ncbi:acetyltransferase [Rhodotorula toruloides]|uniref:Acetyltransferase n=1 Tax=Rhodotorula toruloides TaxID=5286 RepID=A0A511KKE9_RHOTO|nr:acetyltransferase [Rhodotorula toruloides]
MPPRRKPTKPAPSSAAPPPPPPPATYETGVQDRSHNRYLDQQNAQRFRDVLTRYEAKEYTKGLDEVQLILDQYPEHGESLCMKGMFLCCLDRKAEGYELVKRGVKNDMGSHIVWHVYALCLRADKNFEEALKCYKKACEIEKDSLNLLNDLSTLTVHLRHYHDYVGVRLQILRSQPRLRRNWIALAVAQFLAHQYPSACQTLAYYESMLREVPEGDVEFGEVLLFHAKVLEEAGEYERCIEFLSEKSAQIVDRTAYSVQRARLLLKLGRTESALWAWEVLLEENPESNEYIKATVQAQGGDCDATDSTAREHAVTLLDALSTKYPRSLSIPRLALTLCLSSHPSFRTRTSAYLLSALSKGVPSLFADVKALYTADEEGREKARIVGEVVEGFRRSLEEKGAVVTDEIGDDGTADSPSTYLWTLYFLASHYSQLCQPSLALSTLSIALSHTPSLPELHTLRARILKRAGDAVGAAQAMEDARKLDGQDRFLNCKAAKYRIRNGETEEAEKVAGLFTRKDAPSPFEDLVEMQCLWFVQEEGDAYATKEDWARALRRYHQILDIFQEVEEDQYDFHAYCMRKYTLNAYVEMLRFEDKLRDHPRFASAAKSAIEIYCRMHDSPSSFSVPRLPNGSITNGLTGDEAEEKKKREEEEEKARKEEEAEAEEKARKEAEEKEAAAAGAGGKKDKKQGKGKKPAEKPATEKSAKKEPAKEEEAAVVLNVYQDKDPLGVEHITLALKGPLEQALRFLRPLERVRAKDAETWRLKAEVEVRRGKLLSAAQALRTAYSLDASAPSLLPTLIRLAQNAGSATPEPAAVASALSSTLAALFGGSDVPLAQFVDAQLQKYPSNAEWLLQAAEAKRLLGAEHQDGAKELVLQLVKNDELNPTIKQLSRGLAFFGSNSAPSADFDAFRSAAAQKYPLARAFKTAEELQAMNAKLAQESSEVSGEEEA